MILNKLVHALVISSNHHISTNYSELGALGENAWVEFHCLCHVTLDFHLSVHEGVLGLELASKKFHEIVVEHDEGGISLALFAECNSTISVLKIDSDDLSSVALLGTELEVVDGADLGDDTSTLGGEEWLDFLEDFSGLEGHLCFCS